MKLLSQITEPADLKRLPAADLGPLAAEIRDLMISTVSRTGGHLGSNLGVVELTIALHRVFSSPRDCLLFDTGHQAYVHKLLTGRTEDFAQLRQPGGLSGYPCRAESPHDLIENSHASTALSYADGLAKALALRGEEDRHVVALIGDGALTGGMAWEALNNIAHASGRRVIIVVNDNGRSYSPTVGGFRREVFEALGLPCAGPVDGHDEQAVEVALRQAQALGGPAVVLCRTVKGRGYLPAEQDDADCLHSPGPFDRATGQPGSSPGRSWTGVFGEEMARIGMVRPDVVAITAAMLHPTGLTRFAAAFPNRTFDVGIAEQHAVTSAAGMAMGGLHPVVAIYSTFLNRAFDQVLMDVALHRLPVTLVLDRAGVTGNDGPSHNGMWDLSLLHIVPGLRVAAPRDGTRLRRQLREAVDYDSGPTALRFPKGNVPADIATVDTLAGMDLLVRTGPDGQAGPADVLIVSVGAMASECVAAAQQLAGLGLSATVVDPQWIHPVSPCLGELAARHRLVAVVEDNGQVSGAADALRRLLSSDSVPVPVRSFALPQRFHQHGRRSEILQSAGLQAPRLASAISRLAREPELAPAGQAAVYATT